MFHYETLYKVAINDDLGSATYWNTRFRDIDYRLNITESYTATINTAVDNVTAAGLKRLDMTITPAVDAMIAQINTLTADVTALENTVLTDQDSVVSQLNTLLATAQSIVANLQSLGTIQDGTF